MAVPKPIPAELGIHYRLESCGLWFYLGHLLWLTAWWVTSTAWFCLCRWTWFGWRLGRVPRSLWGSRRESLGVWHGCTSQLFPCKCIQGDSNCHPDNLHCCHLQKQIFEPVKPLSEIKTFLIMYPPRSQGLYLGMNFSYVLVYFLRVRILQNAGTIVQTWQRAGFYAIGLMFAQSFEYPPIIW